MSSHDRMHDGTFGFDAQAGDAQAALRDGESGQASVQAAACGQLTLDQAESIAARRLQELAIRLGDQEADAVVDEPGLAPFDADRHLRTRLARRIASLDVVDVDADGETGANSRVKLLSQTGVCARYVVSEALPLSAFGDGLAALSLRGAAARFPVTAAANDAPTGVVQACEPVALIQSSEAAADSGLGHAPDAALEPEMRLADLIREQHALLDRMGCWGDQHEAATSAPAAEARSDAEELFEVGTFAPDAARRAPPLDAAASDPVSLSAEQLIAALEDVTSREEDEEEETPEPGDAREPAADRPVASPLLQHLADHETLLAPRLHFVLHQPSPLREFADGGLTRRARDHGPGPGQEQADDPAPDRPPIIIERARAEMTALANGSAAPPKPQSSAAIGFFVGLSLSLACGVALYFIL